MRGEQRRQAAQGGGGGGAVGWAAPSSEGGAGARKSTATHRQVVQWGVRGVFAALRSKRFAGCGLACRNWANACSSESLSSRARVETGDAVLEARTRPEHPMPVACCAAPMHRVRYPLILSSIPACYKGADACRLG